MVGVAAGLEHFRLFRAIAIFVRLTTADRSVCLFHSNRDSATCKIWVGILVKDAVTGIDRLQPSTETPGYKQQSCTVGLHLGRSGVLRSFLRCLRAQCQRRNVSHLVEKRGTGLGSSRPFTGPRLAHMGFSELLDLPLDLYPRELKWLLIQPTLHPLFQGNRRASWS